MNSILWNRIGETRNPLDLSRSKRKDESDDETPVKKEEPAVKKKEPVKKETPKHPFGLPADCLESTCEFDPVESDRRDDETPKKETPKHSFGFAR